MCHTGRPVGQDAPDWIRHEEINITLRDGAEMPTFVAYPESGSGAPVLVVGDMYGRSLFYEELSKRLAAHGYLAVCPDYFHRQGTLSEQSPENARQRWGQVDETQVLRDLNDAIDYSIELSGVGPKTSGTVGCCLGGTMVLNLAAQRDDLATVCFYGFPEGSKVAEHPATPPREEIPLLAGDLIGFWGHDDRAVDLEGVHAYVSDVRHAGLTFDYEMYDGVGHGFMAAAEKNPGDATGNAVANDAWAKTVEFFRGHLAAA